MKYYKTVADGYIHAIEQRESPAISEEITESEYNKILLIFHNRPTAPEGYGYRLTDALEWVLYELPTEDDDTELSAEEALEIILGDRAV